MENRRTKNRAGRRPGQRSIQGDGRPFGIAAGSQAALVRYADIIPLLAALNLAPDAEALLARRLRGVIADYIGPLVRAERKASHAEALKLLAAIARQSRKLERDLGQLDNDFLVLIDDQRAAIAGREQVHHFNFLHLVPALAHLGRASEQVARTLKPRREGPPGKERLDRAAGTLAAIMEEFGLRVVLHQSGSAAGARRAVGGAGGDLLKVLFAKFDPSVGEANLFGALKRAGLFPSGSAKGAARSK